MPAHGALPRESGAVDPGAELDEGDAQVVGADRPADGPALSVAGAARGLGVATATLRSWERRYGLAPSLHTKGGHRRYCPEDLARLQVMHRLVREGVPPSEAARVAIRSPIEELAPGARAPYAAVLASGRSRPTDAGSDAPADAPVDAASSRSAPGSTPGARPSAAGAGVADVPDEERAAAPGGGRVLPMPRRTRSARGLARAAMALDSVSCQSTIESSLAARGALATWEELVRPVLAAIGDRWAQTGRGVEVEHSFSVVVASALATHSARLTRPRNDLPALLASVPDELHDLPLLALQAALADEGIRAHVVGARTPVLALGDAVLRLGPPVVFLWSQVTRSTVPTLPPMRPAPVVLAGGPGWGEVPDGVGRVTDLPSAVAAVRSAMGL